MSESSGVHVDTNRRGTRVRIRVVSSAKAGESPRATRRRRDRAAREQRADQLPVHPAIAASRKQRS